MAQMGQDAAGSIQDPELVEVSTTRTELSAGTRNSRRRLPPLSTRFCHVAQRRKNRLDHQRAGIKRRRGVACCPRLRSDYVASCARKATSSGKAGRGNQEGRRLARQSVPLGVQTKTRAGNTGEGD